MVLDCVLSCVSLLIYAGFLVRAEYWRVCGFGLVFVLGLVGSGV